MNWDAVGSLAEVFAALAVMATLIYLAVQVRQSRDLLEENRKIALSQVFQSRVGFRMDYHLRLAEAANAEVLAKVGYWDDVETVMEKYMDLSATEKEQFRQMQFASVQMVENAIYQNELGLLENKQFAQSRAYAQRMYPLWMELKIYSPKITEYVNEKADA